MRPERVARLSIVAILALAGTATAQVAGPPDKGEPVTVHSAQVGFNRDEPDKRRFGKLKWIGTLRLTSDNRDFGGISGLEIDAGGERFLAVTDRGNWLRGQIAYSVGRPERIVNVTMGRIAGLGGKALEGKSETDAEAVATSEFGKLTGTAYIAFERNHRIAEHRLTTDGVGPARRLQKLPARIRAAKPNSGLEGLTRLAGGPSRGALLAFTETRRNDAGNHIGWLLGGKRPGAIYLKRRDGFSVTGLASTANGDVFVLERRFRYSEGVKMRIRRVQAKDVQAGKTMDGEILFRANQLFEIDNMEGIAVHTDARGRTILTVISDDNFNSIFQRTLLMQFAVVE